MRRPLDEEVREILAAARVEAALSRQRVVDPEHVFLAVLRHRNTAIQRTFAQLRVKPSDLARRIEILVGQSEHAPLDIAHGLRLELSPRMAQALDVAEMKVTAPGAPIGLPEVLIALIECATGHLSTALREHQITVDGVIHAFRMEHPD